MRLSVHELNQLHGTVFLKLMVAGLLKKFPAFHTCQKVSLLCSLGPAVESCFEPVEFIPCPQTLF
jgi:hypothetical protein